MKNKIKTRWMLWIFFFWMLSNIFYFTIKNRKKNLRVNDFKKIEIFGKVESAIDLGKGNCSLKINDYHSGSILEYRPLKINKLIQKFNVKIGDSVSKAVNSNLLIFYKQNNGIKKKNFVFELKELKSF